MKWIQLKVHRALGTNIFVRDNGEIRELTWDEWDEKFKRMEIVSSPRYVDECVYEASALDTRFGVADLARQVGLYDAIWSPYNNGIQSAHQMIKQLQQGLAQLRDMWEALVKEEGEWNEQGWSYVHLESFITLYLSACEEHPDASILIAPTP